MKVNVPLVTLGLLPRKEWIELDFVGSTIGEMMADIERRYPGFLYWFSFDGKPSADASFEINGKDVLQLQGADTPVNEGDTIELVSCIQTRPWHGYG